MGAAAAGALGGIEFLIRRASRHASRDMINHENILIRFQLNAMHMQFEGACVEAVASLPSLHKHVEQQQVANNEASEATWQPLPSNFFVILNNTKVLLLSRNKIV